jgi:DNA-binding transcriptional MocR family regulator
MRQRINVYLPPELVAQVVDLAACKKLSQSAIMEAAVACFLSPDGADRREAAFTRRLDRLTRHLQRHAATAAARPGIGAGKRA